MKKNIRQANVKRHAKHTKGEWKSAGKPPAKRLGYKKKEQKGEESEFKPGYKKSPTGARPERFGSKKRGDEASKSFKPRSKAPVKAEERIRKPYPEKKNRFDKQERKGKSINVSREAITEKALKDGPIRLNRFISNAGICSRREADKLIGAGLVSVNGKVVTEMGYKVKQGDDIRYNGERLAVEEKIYLLMNKPKDTITTANDPDGRKTVWDLIEGGLAQRVYAVGRLDRNTTGVLLLTNDGELATRLMHPKHNVSKVYKATLNKAFKKTDMWQLANGLELEDGFIQPDGVAFPDPQDKATVGIEIHSGRNRIIHRMFEHMGYLVDRLDRVAYAGLTKAKLKRGEWRNLTDKEVKALKSLVRIG